MASKPTRVNPSVLRDLVDFMNNPPGGGDMLKSTYDTDNDGKVDQAENADTLDGSHAADFAPAAHGHAGTDITSGTIDGDRLPALSSTKKGAAPATGTPSGKFLKDDGTWATPAGGGDAFPVGSVFISVVATNPATLLGYGTWAAFGAGRVLVGIDSGDADFDTVEETGGAKTKAISAHAGAAVGNHYPESTGGASSGSTQRGTTASTVTTRPQ